MGKTRPIQGTGGGGTSGNVALEGICTTALTKNNDITISDVTGMSVTLQANSKYIGYVYIIGQIGGAPDLDIQLSNIVGATAKWTTSFATNAVTDGFSEIRLAGQSTGNVNLYGPMPFIIETVANGGNLQLRAGQGTAVAENTVVRTGSIIRAWKVE